MTLKEMLEKRAKLIAEARSKLDEIKDDTPAERAKELEARADEILASLKDLDAKIEREKQMAALEERQTESEQRAIEENRPGIHNLPDDQRAERPTYQKLFFRAIAFGLGEFTREEREIFAAHQSADAGIAAEVRALQQRAGMVTGTNAAGGFLVPTDLFGAIEKVLEQWGPMLAESNGFRVFNTTSGNKVTFPVIDYTAERGETHAEGGATTQDGTGTPTIGQKDLDGYINKTPIVPISLELLQDSAFDVEALMAELFGESLGRTVNEVLTNGDGSNKQHGLFTAAGAGKTAAAASAITADELIDLVHSVDPAYRQSPGCRFMFADTTLAAIRKLKDGQGNYLWQMGDVRAGEPSQILGHAYTVNTAAPVIASGVSPIVFGDMSRYTVRKINGTTVVPFREKFMDNLQIGTMAFMRTDGELMTNKAVKKLTMA